MTGVQTLSGDSTPRVAQPAPSKNVVEESSKKEEKSKMRTFFAFGKKKTEISSKAGPSTEAPSLSKESTKMSSTTQSTTQSTTSPTRSTHLDNPFAIPVSPSRVFPNSPHVSSPATSQIFERDVQDSAFIPRPTSSAIPNHIQTENYIPSVLDDASEAITNRRLDPDAVEIVTHMSHQPASVTVTGTSALNTPSPYDHSNNEWTKELASFADRIGFPTDGASNYGSLDSADVRRLSFISFADVVSAEHGTQHLGHVRSRENLHMAGLTSLSPSALNRSPSPLRSPVSSQGPGTSPPTSNPGSIKGLDLSPPRKTLGSPTSAHYSLAPGDLNIETMTQALRRTASTELNRYRSTPQSPVDGPGSR